MTFVKLKPVAFTAMYPTLHDRQVTRRLTKSAHTDAPCGAGNVLNYPITAKRIGDTPPGVVADPASVPAPSPMNGPAAVR
jgi:hypothetical protein